MARPSSQLVLYLKHDYRVPRVPEEQPFRELWLRRTPTAPLPWWQQAASLAPEAALMALASRLTGPRQIVLMPIALVLGLRGYPLVAKFEERRARRLGLTIDTTPEPSAAGCLNTLPWLVAWKLFLRLRHVKPAPAPWPEQLAARILSEWYRRRSWNRTMAKIRAGATLHSVADP